MSAEKFATWESAVRWLVAQPEQQELVRACYFDEPLTAAARRYAEGDEWQAVRALLPARHGDALDVGAGRGIASYALARDGWRTTALEPDPSAFVGAGAIRALAADAGVHIDVVEEFGERLPFGDDAFDLVHARQVLHHARDLAAFCREVHRVLRPGGTLVATREHVLSRKSDLGAFRDRHPLHRLYGGENAYLLNEYKSAIVAAGFQLTQVLAPFASVINFAPFTRETLRQELISRAGAIPGGRLVGAVAFARPWFDGMRTLLSLVDRRPGRLYTFVAVKPLGSA